jgi:hypothetical protein
LNANADPLLNENVFTLKMKWKGAKEYCEQRGMQMATLKTSHEVQQVAEQLKQRGLNRKIKRADFEIEICNCSLGFRSLVLVVGV